MALKDWFGIISLFTALLQLRPLMQNINETMDERERKDQEVKRLQGRLLNAVDSEEIRLLKDSLKLAKKELRELNTEFYGKVANILMVLTKIALILISLSFGPAAPLLPVAMVIIDVVMDFLGTVIDQSLALY